MEINEQFFEPVRIDDVTTLVAEVVLREMKNPPNMFPPTEKLWVATSIYNGRVITGMGKTKERAIEKLEDIVRFDKEIEKL